MKRWTNGLPGATKRLGAMMAQRGLSASQPRMRADTHDGPEQMLHVRGLIHCCSSHVRRSWSFCLATHGPGHTYIVAALTFVGLGASVLQRTARAIHCGTKRTWLGGLMMSASLIGPSGSSTFRLSINAVSM